MLVKLYSELNYDERLILLIRNFVGGFISEYYGIINTLENEIGKPELAILREALEIIEQCHRGL